MRITVEIPTGDGDTLEVPLAQALSLARLHSENPGSTWHFNDCGCCICLHPGGEKSRGWIIGADGEAELHEHAGPS